MRPSGWLTRLEITDFLTGLDQWAFTTPTAYEAITQCAMNILLWGDKSTPVSFSISKLKPYIGR